MAKSIIDYLSMCQVKKLIYFKKVV
jgi:hypothetical protein